MTDVNDLLARLRQTSGSRPEHTRTSSFSTLKHPRPQSAASLPAAFANIATPPPTMASSDSRANNLLNLLKFNSTPTGTANLVQSASDSSPRIASNSEHAKPAAATTTSHQDALMRLLNSSRAPSASIPQSPSAMFNVSKEADSPARSSELSQPRSQSKVPGFRHVNPFDALAAKAQEASKNINVAGQEIPYALVEDISTSGLVSPPPAPLPDGRTPLEALIGIGAEPKATESVSKALRDTGEKVQEQAADALARTESSVAKPVSHQSLRPQDDLQMAATDILEEMKDPDTMAAYEKGMPPEMAAAFEKTIAGLADGREVADTWDSAEDAEDQSCVLEFPMKPFVSISIQASMKPTARVRDDVLMKIASLKREFDQVDRTLAAATNNHIVYAMAKGGGFRVIRQDDGANQHVFKSPANAIFNLAIGGLPKSEVDPEPVLATAANGSVFWMGVPVPNTEPVFDVDLNTLGFQFPPLPSQEDNTSGAPLKTRAKLSNRHAEFFALGRGKSIYIIWPKIALLPQYCDPATRIVDSVKYLNERSLKIATGKAGKDFAFSRDDTVIASLDKAGRLKFWDIQEHTDPELCGSETTLQQVEAKIPSMTLLTSALDKSAATSVTFIDKDRPHSRGSVSRYMLVGSKQNHVLTLWDLALGKPVQELSFPQESDLDPICSVTFNAKMGLIVVGHPKRNSFFVITLSAPRYNLSNMNQASFISRVANKDPTLPKPESTAILSNMREISLDGVGELRSLEICNPAPAGDQEVETVLEVYLMHSRGVTCLNLKKQDLGLGDDGKPLNAANALELGHIKVEDLRPIAAVEGSDICNGTPVKPKSLQKASEATPLSRNGTLKAKKEQTDAAINAPAPSPAILPSSEGQAARVPPPIKEDTKPTMPPTKAKPTASPMTKIAPPQPAPSQPAPASASAPLQQPLTLANILLAEKANKQAPASLTTEATPPPPNQGEMFISAEDVASRISGTLGQTIATSMGGVLSSTFAEVLGDQLEKLYRRIEDDKRVQDAAGAAKQDAILRLVASTLTDNVEKSLGQIVGLNIQQHVLPSIKTVVSQSVDKRVSETLGQQLMATLPRELKAALAPGLARVMQDPETLRIISDLVSAKISTHVEEVFGNTLRDSIVPSFTQVATESAKRVAIEVENRVQGQLVSFDLQRKEDGAKMDELLALTSELLVTVKTMSSMQGAMQDEIVRLQSELAQSQRQADSKDPEVSSLSGGPGQDIELAAVANSMADGNFEEGTMRWLQSTRHAELFDKIFCQLDPAYLRDMNQIVILSVAAAVSNGMDRNVGQRLIWLGAALTNFDTGNPDTAEHAYNVLNTITDRLQEAYMSIADETPSDSILPRISKLVRRLREMKKLFA